MNHDLESIENLPKTNENQMQDQKAKENLSMATSSIVEGKDSDKTSVEEVLARLNQDVTNNNALLSEIRNLIESKVGTNQNKDEAIVRMQRRLEEHEKGLVRSIKEPLIRDIILFYDSLTKFSEKFIAKTTAKATAKEFVHDLKILREELLQVLFSQDVEIIETKINCKYDRDTQKVVRTEPTDKSEDNEIVSHIVRDGFIGEGKILRKQEIVVKKYIEKIPN